MDPDSRRVDWTITDPSTDELVGWFLLYNFNSRNRSAEFGFGLVRAMRGKGSSKKLLTTAFHKAFREFDLKKIYCHTASFNHGSIQALMALNLLQDGVLRAHHELDGTLHDEIIYSLLRDEWTTVQ